MKKSMIISVLIATLFFSCKTQQKSTGYTYDDVYSNKSDPANISPNSKIQNKDLSASHAVVSADSSSSRPAAVPRKTPQGATEARGLVPVTS